MTLLRSRHLIAMSVDHRSSTVPAPPARLAVGSVAITVGSVLIVSILLGTVLYLGTVQVNGSPLTAPMVETGPSPSH